MTKLKVIKSNPKTIEDRLREIMNTYSDILDEECDTLIVLSYGRDHIRYLSNQNISYFELEQLLHEAKQSFFVEGIVRTVGFLLDNGDL